MAKNVQRRLAAILAADVVGYSRLMGEDETGTLAQLKAHRKDLINPKIAEHLLEGIWCLDPSEGLSPGQADEIDRVHAAYPDLNDDDFVRANLERWLG